ncbi:MAG TPA: sigma-70 family RNA polymerase sigma factor [Candidatus Bathyarchaeia archaeon]|nr:sigma-70 family RNA polymerase sigma factor [Candidatus Bathyarchaeia archaeon]
MLGREVILDKQAIQDVLSGERERFGELVERYMPVVQATAMARLRNVSDTEDVVQETFLRAFQSLDRLRVKEKFGAWLLTIARNVCNTLLARRGREASLHEATPPLAVEPSASGEAAELDGLLHEELLKLGENHREVLLMHYFAGRSLTEMESLLGVSRLALAKRLQRAREALGERMLKRVEAGRYRVSQEKVSTVMKAIVVAPVSWGLTETASLTRILYPARQLGELVIAHKLIAVPILLVAGLVVTLAIGPMEALEKPIPAVVTSTADLAAVPPAAATVTETVADVAAAAAESADASTEAVEKPVDLSDPKDVWRKVVEVNRVWLDPRPTYLRYTLNMGGPEPGNTPELVHRVWIDGDKGRWETEGSQMVFDSQNAVYLQPYGLLQRSPMPMENASTYRQGLMWHTALHAFARRGLPENARIVESTDAPSENIVVIEAEPEKTGAAVGFGLGGTWFGKSSYPVSRVRLHIQTPEFVPVLEEDFAQLPDGGERRELIEIGPEFLAFGSQSAPKVLAYHSTLLDDREWVLRAEFQKKDDAWILREGLNLQEGKPSKRIYVTNVSTAAFSPALVEMPSEEELAALKTALPKQEPAQASAEGQPVVVGVFPAHAAKNVAVQTELRIQFDRPMDPDRMGIAFEKGGLRDFSAAQYDAESYEFVVPVRLTPGEQQFIAVNSDDDGFLSADGVKAAQYRWGFETAAVPSRADAPEPRVASLSPAPGDTVACLTFIEVVFDQPMDPSAGYIVDLSKDRSLMGGAQLLADVQYDERGKRFLLPVSFPPDWQGDIELRGFRTVEGAAAAPVPLHLSTTREPFSESSLERFKKAAKDPRLLTVLSEMRQARQHLTSVSEHVMVTYAFGVVPVELAPFIKADGGTFRFQGNRQFYGDVNLSTNRFVVAGDGDQCWWLCTTTDKNGQTEESVQAAPHDTIGKKNILICDPFDLEGHDVDAATAELHLEYEGMVSFNGRQAHVIKSTTADLPGDWTEARIIRWWIDSHQLMPVQVAVNQLCMRSLYTFAYEGMNEPIPDTEFALPPRDDAASQPFEPLTDGDTTRFLTVVDGGNGRMSVRWGNAASSSGLN